MGSVSKMQRQDEDRISALPKSVRCHILSFLETLDAVRTTVLSTRWKDIWTSVPNLDLGDDKSFWKRNNEEDDDYSSNHFLNFVDRVLFLRDSSDIQRFRLFSNNQSDIARILGWIYTAIWRNVAELDFHLCVNKHRCLLSFPQSLFMCKTLVSLRIFSDCTTYYPPASGCFPSLKFLHVTLHLPQENSVQKLITCCPVLEGLSIDGILGTYEDLSFEVSGPKLKTLKVKLSIGTSCDPYNVFINDAPVLEDIDISQNTMSNYYFENVESLARVNLVLVACRAKKRKQRRAFVNRAIDLLRRMSNVKHLSISAECDFGCFMNNYHGEDDVASHDCYYWELLPTVLKISYNLEYLVLEDCQSPKFKTKHSDSPWNPPEFVPVCLFNLKAISIRGFKGRQVEMDVAKYMLKNGIVLSKMTIYTSRDLHIEEKKLHQEFSLFEKASKSCQVKLIKM